MTVSSQPEHSYRAQGVAPANWYSDPGGTNQLRYWDGSQWTSHFHPLASNVSMQLAAQDTRQGASRIATFPPVSEHRTFLFAMIAWAIAAIWGLVIPFVVKAVQQAQARAIFDAQVYGSTSEERYLAEVFGRANDSFTSWVTGPIYAVWILLAFIGFVGYVVVLFLLFKGNAGARIAATILSGLSVLAIVAAGWLTILYVLLNIAGAVLIWQASSTRYLETARHYALSKKSTAFQGARM